MRFVPSTILYLVCVVACLMAIPTRGDAQAPRLVWRGLIGETALEVRVSGTDVLVGAAGDVESVSAAFRASDVRRFVDTLARRLTRARARDTTWTLRVEEPGVSSGAMSITPEGRDDRRQRLYGFFLADDIVSPVRQRLTTREVNLLLRTLREASAPAKPARKAAPPSRRRAPNVKPKAPA
jgi:hypothetical protein